MERRDRIILSAFILSVAGLFLEQTHPSQGLFVALQALDFVVLGLILWETISEIVGATYRWNYIRKNIPSLLFVLSFTILFAYTKSRLFMGARVENQSLLSQLLRNVFLILKIFGRLRKLSAFAERFSVHPAQTIIVSFLLVILTGSLLLMMPFAAPGGKGLSLINAIFTATSAVCVTGLVVVDTARDLTIAGQLVVLTLIQIGGLGVMVYSFFGLFALRRRVSIKDKLTVSYMLSEDDMSGLSRSLRTIVLSTFTIEGIGAALLYARLAMREGPGLKAVYHAVFHSVSAFCNAGFSLYSDSMESFRADPWITLIIAALIIVGGISFGVINDGRKAIRSAARRLRGRPPSEFRGPSQNTRAVVTITGGLLAAGIILFYLLEHEGVMASYGLGEQYLAAFFQSVTLRTAGFNSVPFDHLRAPTLIFMILFMFIGGASGSTAGGIKVNTLAAIGAYFASFLRQERTARIGHSAVPTEKVGRAFLILIFGLVAVSGGVFVLSISEGGEFLPLLFETVSAFGTVGLSTGITPGLSPVGKVTLVVLMFLGRLGPLTILTAARRRVGGTEIEYPDGDLAIG